MGLGILFSILFPYPKQNLCIFWNIVSEIEFVVKVRFEYVHNLYLSVNPKGQSRGYFQKICHLERTIEIFGVYSIHKFIKKGRNSFGRWFSQDEGVLTLEFPLSCLQTIVIAP